MDSDSILLDLHLHSRYSRDSILSLKEIHKNAAKKSVTPVICDHNSIKGSDEYHKRGFFWNERIPPFFSEEIRTTHGEIIGIFLNEEITPYQSPEETLDCIGDQGGLAIIPHPGDRYRKSAMSFDTITVLQPKIHAIEAYNSRTLLLGDISRAELYAAKNNLLVTGGSDAHTPFELFRTTIRIAPFDNPKEFIQNLAHANIQFRRSIPFVHMISVIAKRARIC